LALSSWTLQRQENIADPVRAYRVLLHPGEAEKVVAAPRRAHSRFTILAESQQSRSSRWSQAFCMAKAFYAPTPICCGTAVCKT
jgi:hypothetical protein